MPRPAPTPDRDRVRWLSYVDQSGGPDACHPWMGSRSKGYGNFGLKGRGRTRAHRSGWELFVGPIPDGLFVCHSCDNPACCNPKHWFLGTHRQNMRDMIQKGRRKDIRPPVHFGEKHPGSKLTQSQVREIREAYVGRYGQKAQLAREFGVSTQQIFNILSMKHWVDVK